MVTKRKPPEPSGSPIIVDGGGSIKIKFDHGAYDQRGDEHRHKHNSHIASPEIDSIEITGQQPIKIASGAKATVTIHLRE